MSGRQYLSMITGSEGVSLRFPQLFLSQHRLREEKKTRGKVTKGSGKANTQCSILKFKFRC